VLGISLGHARLSNRMEGPRAPVSKAVWEVLGQLLENDYGAFVRWGIAQMTQGAWSDELAERMQERVPVDIGRTAYSTIMSQVEDIGEVLRRLDVPLLFAKHEGCLASTDEGWEDMLAAFPDAQTVSVGQAPTVSADFAEALRSFCLEHSPAGSGVDRQ
jgi:hypothetical protein